MPKLVKLWIIGSTAFVVAGWTLSAFRQLSGLGYLAFFALLGGILVFWRWSHPRLGQPVPAGTGGSPWSKKLRRRFRRALPLCFLITAILGLVGGAIFAPSNYDALMYRVPRMLHWWDHGGWLWFATPVPGMNRSGTNFEWLMMPLFLLTHSDRLFFLINIASFLLLPSLLFAFLLAAGVKKRVAWNWMWLLPAGFCFAMQAGSIGNDILAPTYILAALTFWLRAARSGSADELRYGLLAAGLGLGVKASNLPLLLPLVCAAGPIWRLLRVRPALNAATILVSLLISFLPTAVLNQEHTGDWAGDPTNAEGLAARSPLPGLVGNGFQLAEQTLIPPIFPFARPVSAAIWDDIPKGVRTWLLNGFPSVVRQVGELPQEEGTGLGLGLVLLVASATAFALIHRSGMRSVDKSAASRIGRIIGWASWISLLAYMAKIAAPAPGRLLAAYYPLMLLPLWLHPTQEILVRRRWWKRLSLTVAALPVIPLVLTPSRPLWPAESVLAAAHAKFPQSAQIARAQTVYQVYKERNDSLAPVRQYIPASAATVGLIESGGDMESSLWRPYGHRRVVLLNETNLAQCRAIEWVVVKNAALGEETNALDQWLRQTGGRVAGQATITGAVGEGPTTWSVVQFKASHTQ